MKTKSSSFQKPLTIFTVLLVGFIDYFGIGLVYPLFSTMFFNVEIPFFVVETTDAVRGFYLGLLLALQPLFQFFSAPILGTLSDQLGRRKILTVALIIALVGYATGVLAIFYYNLYALMLYRIIVGISAGSTAVVQASLSDISTPKTKSKNFGLYNMALGTGFTVGPFLGGKLTDPSVFSWASFYAPFLVTVAVILFNLFLVVLFFKDTLKIKVKKEICVWTGIIALKKIVKLKQIRILFLSIFIFIFGWSFFFEFLPVYLIRFFQFQSKDIGNLFGISGAIFAISSGVLIRPIVSRFRADSILFWGLIVNACIIFSIFLAQSTLLLYGLIGLTNFIMALCFPSLTTLVSNTADERMQGEVLGVLNSTYGLAFAVSPLFSGALIGAYPALSIFVGGFCMFLASMFLAHRRFKNA